MGKRYIHEGRGYSTFQKLLGSSSTNGMLIRPRGGLQKIKDRPGNIQIWKVNSNQIEILTRIELDEVVKMLVFMLFMMMGNEEAQTEHLWQIVDDWAKQNWTGALSRD